MKQKTPNTPLPKTIPNPNPTAVPVFQFSGECAAPEAETNPNPTAVPMFKFRGKCAAAVMLGLCVTILMSNMLSFAADCELVRGDVLRLHILANSDSDEDQALKLAVRDRVLQEARSLFAGSQNKAEAEAEAAKQLPALLAAAQDELLRQGSSYPVQGELVDCYFQTREYEGFTLPAGMYRALRLKIGSGKGHNWWCVMFPPMCIPVSLEEEPDLSKFTKRELELIQRHPQYEPRFAVVELIEKLYSQAKKSSPMAG